MSQKAKPCVSISSSRRKGHWLSGFLHTLLMSNKVRKSIRWKDQDPWKIISNRNKVLQDAQMCYREKEGLVEAGCFQDKIKISTFNFESPLYHECQVTNIITSTYLVPENFNTCQWHSWLNCLSTCLFIQYRVTSVMEQWLYSLKFPLLILVLESYGRRPSANNLF